MAKSNKNQSSDAQAVIVTQICTTLRWLIVCLTVLAGLWMIRGAFDKMMDTFDSVIKLASVGVWMIAPYGIFGVQTFWIYRYTKRVTSRIQMLESERNPGRSSSGLDKAGKPPPELP